jgi:glycosyltransferase involved in cell wall biosynthesis
MFGTGRAGGNKVIVKLAESLASRGYDVTILFPGRVGDNEPHYEVRSLRFSPFPLPSAGIFVPFRTIAITFPMARLLRGFDVVVANYSPTTLPVKMSMHGQMKCCYVVQHDETTFFTKVSLEHWIAKLSYRSFDEIRFFAVSNWLREMVHQRSGHDAVIIPPGINHEVFYPRKRLENVGHTVLFLARPERWRGIRILMEAMKIVKREIPDVRLLAAGKPNSAIAPECPISYIQPTDDELASLYSSCDVFVLPSILEGLPVPPLEAMACGAPVVLSDCMGTRDYAVDGINCLIVPPRNPKAMGKAIVDILSNEKLAEALRKNGPPTARPWTFERMSRAFVDGIEEGSFLRS